MAAFQHFDEPTGRPLRRLLRAFQHGDRTIALPEIADRIRQERPLLSAFSQWIEERADAKCGDALELLGRAQPRPKGRSKRARARRRAARMGDRKCA